MWNVVWLKRDLRIEDHWPLSKACEFGNPVAVYFFEPDLLANEDQDLSHQLFIIQSLKELKTKLENRNISLICLRMNAVEAFRFLKSILKNFRIWSHEESTQLSAFARDRRVKSWCKSEQINWIETPQFGVFRKLKSRDDWADRWHTFMLEPKASSQKISTPKNYALEELLKKAMERYPLLFVDLNLSFIQDFFANQKISSKGNDIKNNLLFGGEVKAFECMQSFLDKRSLGYRKNISSPLFAWDGCSRISPYLTYGCISMRQVFQSTQKVKKKLFEEGGESKSMAMDLHAFASRLRWHCHFIQKLEDEPEIEIRNMNPGFDGLREQEFNSSFYDAWRFGMTGFPFVDACMRALEKHRWINFRMRAFLVSFASYALWLDWKKFGCFLATRFLDYEPGIHYSQLQMQAGTTGINTIRIYSALKQSMDQDPEGVFIRRFVPELSQVPTQWIHAPHLMSFEDQNRYACLLGKSYPYPIVDHKTAIQSAKEKIFSWKKREEVKRYSKEVFNKHGSRKEKKNKTNKTRALNHTKN